MAMTKAQQAVSRRYQISFRKEGVLNSDAVRHLKNMGLDPEELKANWRIIDGY